MDSIITSVLTPNVTPPAKEPALSGTITNLPPALNLVKPGDSLLLQSLIDNNAFQLNSNANVSLMVGEETIPLNLRLEQPLPPNVNPQEVHQLMIKVVGRQDNNLTVKVTNIDRRPLQTTAPMVSDNSALKAVPSTAPKLPLLPLSLKAAVSSLLEQHQVAPSLRAEILKNVPDLQLAPTISKIVPAETARTPALAEPLQQLITTLQRAENPQPLIGKLIDNLATLTTRELPAVVGEVDGLKVLETPLGKIIPEMPLKLENGTELRLNLIAQSRPQADPLPQLLESLQKVIRLLPSVEQSLSQFIGQQLNAAKPEPSLAPLLKILAPLQNLPDAGELAAKILEQVPAGNEKMLSNLHAFYKAASSGRVADWLGEKVTSELTKGGEEGRAVISRAAEFVSSNTREIAGWRIVEMPFFDGSTLARVKLALRKNSDEDESDPSITHPKGGIRFLLETNFSRLGAFQLDGFAIAAERRFDLVIRTAKKQQADMVSQLMNLFKISLHDVNYAGNIYINQQETFFRLPDDSSNQLTDGLYI